MGKKSCFLKCLILFVLAPFAWGRAPSKPSLTPPAHCQDQASESEAAQCDRLFAETQKKIQQINDTTYYSKQKKANLENLIILGIKNIQSRCKTNNIQNTPLIQDFLDTQTELRCPRPTRSFIKGTSNQIREDGTDLRDCLTLSKMEHPLAALRMAEYTLSQNWALQDLKKTDRLSIQENLKIAATRKDSVSLQPALTALACRITPQDFSTVLRSLTEINPKITPESILKQHLNRSGTPWGCGDPASSSAATQGFMHAYFETQPQDINWLSDKTNTTQRKNSRLQEWLEKTQNMPNETPMGLADFFQTQKETFNTRKQAEEEAQQQRKEQQEANRQRENQRRKQATERALQEAEQKAARRSVRTVPLIEPPVFNQGKNESDEDDEEVTHPQTRKGKKQGGTPDSSWSRTNL